jgi:hypothetical protein
MNIFRRLPRRCLPEPGALLLNIRMIARKTAAIIDLEALKVNGSTLSAATL